jgi:hypothetical protein
MDYRKEIEILLKKREENEDRLKELAYLLYKSEVSSTLQGVPVECSGYKKVLRHLGFVI